jgi:hypothetical protein
MLLVSLRSTGGRWRHTQNARLVRNSGAFPPESYGLRVSGGSLRVFGAESEGRNFRVLGGES